MAENPEQVLPHQNVTASTWIEKSGSKRAVKRKHDAGHGDHWQRQNQQNLSHEGGPNEDRHLEQGHARGAHVQNRCKKVNRSNQRGQSEDLNSPHPEIHGVSRVVLLQRQVGVSKPAHRRDLADQVGGIQQKSAEQENPEAQGVEARKSHVRGTDQKRREVVKERSAQGHDEQKDHRRAVHGHQAVISLGRDDVIVWHCQLGPHQEGVDSRDDHEQQGRNSIKDADSFVVHGGDPAPDSGF